MRSVGVWIIGFVLILLLTRQNNALISSRLLVEWRWVALLRIALLSSRLAVRIGRTAGTLLTRDAPEGLAELLTSITLGFVAQRALAGSADVEAHVAALEALTDRPASDRIVR